MYGIRKAIKSGFTLAEVLIVIGIIGVIAETTIPTLVSNYQKQQTVENLKTVYSQLNQALDSAKVENGTDINTWYVPNDSTTVASEYFAKNYLLPFLKTTKICGNSTSSDCVLRADFLNHDGNYMPISGASDRYSFVLVNGAVVQVYFNELNGTSVSQCRIQLYIDINGFKKPNILGKDAFLIELGSSGLATNKNKFVPYYISNVANNRNSVLDTSNVVNCNKYEFGLACFALIMLDDWQIKDDYPW